jgi:hypothetical protein
MSIATSASRKAVFAKLFFLACLSLAASTATASAQANFRGWGPSYRYDSGWNPNVAQYGSTVVEVHNGSGAAGKMWYKVGQVQSNNTIAWGHSWPYDSGWNPNVALYGTTVVEVHNGSGAAGKMWYKVGQVQSNNTIAWGHSWPYDSGWNPNVALYGTTVVEVHNGSGTPGQMWFRVGQVQPNYTIAWGHSWPYDSGWNPKVAIFGYGGNVLEVHNGAGTAGPMWYHWGYFTSSTTINFGWISGQYDWGYNPSVAVGDSAAPVEVHDGGGTAGPEWYHVGNINVIQ